MNVHNTWHMGMHLCVFSSMPLCEKVAYLACHTVINFNEHLGPIFIFCLILYAAELLTTNKLSELACLALYLMYEKKQGKNSFWYPYIRELDRQRGRGQLAVESPLLWSEAELAYLTGSPTKVILCLFSFNRCKIIPATIAVHSSVK